MVSHHFVYQLVLFALIWLFVMLHLSRPKQTSSTHPLHRCGINSTLFRTGVGGQRYAVCTRGRCGIRVKNYTP
jgi:hypothetical protein